MKAAWIVLVINMLLMLYGVSFLHRHTDKAEKFFDTDEKRAWRYFYLGFVVGIVILIATALLKVGGLIIGGFLLLVGWYLWSRKVPGVGKGIYPLFFTLFEGLLVLRMFDKGRLNIFEWAVLLLTFAIIVVFIMDADGELVGSSTKANNGRKKKT